MTQHDPPWTSDDEVIRKLLRPVALDQDADGVPNTRPDTSHEDLENAELVHRALDEISLEHRQVLTLRFLEEMSVEEIAEVTGILAGTVKSRLHYARLALGACIKELENG